MRVCSLFVVAALVAAGVAGCGSDSGDPGAARTETQAATTTARPASVAVLGSRVSVTPAGRVDVTLRVRQPADVDPPIAKTAQLTLPKGVAWKGGGAASCELAVLRRGVDACPAAAVIGSGEAIGVADQSETVGKIVVVNGGQDHIYLATTVRNPAYVKTVVPGAISSDAEGGVSLRLAFPPALQTIAGVPVGLQQLKLTIRGGHALDVEPCPDAGWPYAASVAFDDGTKAEHAGTVTCSGAPSG